MSGVSLERFKSLCCVQLDELHEAMETSGRKAKAAKEPLSIKVNALYEQHLRTNQSSCAD